jgi:hypothetical protein
MLLQRVLESRKSIPVHDRKRALFSASIEPLSARPYTAYNIVAVTVTPAHRLHNDATPKQYSPTT